MENLDFKIFNNILAVSYERPDSKLPREFIARELGTTKIILKPYFDKLVLLDLYDEIAMNNHRDCLFLTTEGKHLILEGIGFETYYKRTIDAKEKEEMYKEHQYANEKHTFRTNSITFYLMVVGAILGAAGFVISLITLLKSPS